MLLGLSLVPPLAGPGEAAAAEPRPRRALTRPALPPAQLEALRRWLCPNGGMPVRGKPGRCDGRGGRGGGGGGGTEDAAGWYLGLPPAQGGQLACPEGTKPTLARGHTDTMRCVPG
ncbi:hypothetical protein LPC08_11600 [Roseomonas sp. OT10]|uniref:hypothetical protein n=1 Tax=Roseomonas cutis TaxID=2897332 RepID=UPI001E3670A0|nr:hypothetical protein [Roseomonas sp. OT10]UFN51192.1 hypothetical protein LPC08_11600 [Roseomonas sp. OT10]